MLMVIGCLRIIHCIFLHYPERHFALKEGKMHQKQLQRGNVANDGKVLLISTGGVLRCFVPPLSPPMLF